MFFQWLNWLTLLWLWNSSLMAWTYILQIRIMVVLRSLGSRFFPRSRFWRGSHMLWTNIFLSIFFIWRNWGIWTSWGILTWIPGSYRMMMFLFLIFIINYCLCLFLLIFMFENYFEIFFWWSTKSPPFFLFSCARLLRIMDWLLFAA